LKMLRVVTCLCLFTSSCHLASVENQDKEHDRVLHGKPLSSKDHDDHDGFDYDHEAFLGDEADEFDELEPEEAQRRLGLIADKIDEDQDGFITIPELQKWIKTTQARYIDEDTEKQWETNKAEDKDTINWEEYRNAIYGFLDNSDMADDEENGFSYKEMEARDNRRWLLADVDHDGELTKQEFQAFLHPEHADHMRDIVVTETFEDIDKDKDGKISMEEYIGDMYHGGEGEEEPDWVASEREQFTKFRDSNGDGYMDKEEVTAWIIPPDFDHSEAEAKHLIFEADVDADNKLTKDEILDKYDLFVGSQATDFGEALTRHDEF